MDFQLSTDHFVVVVTAGGEFTDGVGGFLAGSAAWTAEMERERWGMELEAKGRREGVFWEEEEGRGLGERKGLEEREVEAARAISGTMGKKKKKTNSLSLSLSSSWLLVCYCGQETGGSFGGGWVILGMKREIL